MVNWRDLKLAQDKSEANWDDLPEQTRAFVPAIYPDTYEFELPKSLEHLWEAFEAKNPSNPEGPKVQRVALQFSAENPLPAVRSASGAHNGERYMGRISNMERNRAKQGEPKKFVSDMHYLLRDGLKSAARPQVSLEWITEVNKYGGKHFVADAEWTAFCSKEKVVYVFGDETKTTTIEHPGGQKGCGKNVYMSAIPKVDGVYQERFYCPQCAAQTGSVLRAFAQLTRFRAVGE